VTSYVICFATKQSILCGLRFVRPTCDVFVTGNDPGLTWRVIGIQHVTRLVGTRDGTAFEELGPLQ
jgi:hypothetical protein